MVAEPLNLVPDESGPSVPEGGNAGAADSTKTSRFNPTFTDSVIAATGPKANARLAQVMPSLLRHLHDFARENEITVDEWTAAVEMVCLSFSLAGGCFSLLVCWLLSSCWRDFGANAGAKRISVNFF